MWAGTDNGKGVSWKKAVKYCGDLRLAGYLDWRLATLAELEAIYDRNANAPGRAGQRDVTWHVKGNLFLTGYAWSSNRRMDDRGRPSGYEWYFDFGDGRSDNDPSGFRTPSSVKRALCVRLAAFGRHQVTVQELIERALFVAAERTTIRETACAIECESRFERRA